MEAKGYKVLLKNTPRNEIDLTSKANVPSLSGAETTKDMLQCKLKEVSDKAMFCVVDATICNTPHQPCGSVSTMNQ